MATGRLADRIGSGLGSRTPARASPGLGRGFAGALPGSRPSLQSEVVEGEGRDGAARYAVPLLFPPPPYLGGIAQECDKGQGVQGGAGRGGPPAGRGGRGPSPSLRPV